MIPPKISVSFSIDIYDGIPLWIALEIPSEISVDTIQENPDTVPPKFMLEVFF